MLEKSIKFKLSVSWFDTANTFYMDSSIFGFFLSVFLFMSNQLFANIYKYFVRFM